MQPYGVRSVQMTTITASDHQVLLGAWSYADDEHIDAHRDGIIRQARQLLAQNAQIVAIELTGDITMRVER